MYFTEAQRRIVTLLNCVPPAVRGEEVVDVLLRRRRLRVAEADERAIAAALEESARHADARGGLLVLVGAGLLAGAAARGRARRLVMGVLGLLAWWPNAIMEDIV